MGDLIDEDLEFRGGTLQLSADLIAAEQTANTENNAAETSNKNKPKPTAHSSVLSGADSLTSSTSSFTASAFRKLRTAVSISHVKVCNLKNKIKLRRSHPCMYNNNGLINNARNDEQRPAGEEAGGSSVPSDNAHVVNTRYDVPFNKDNIKDFFTFRNGVVENAIRECITVLLFPEDGEYLGSWLLTEITLWDNEKERIVLLTSRLVMTIKYDFIAMKQLDFKKTYLDDLDTLVIGELVYPPSSLVPRLNGIATGVTTVVKDCVIDRLCRRPSPVAEESKLFDTKYFEPRERNLRGVRLMWNKGEPLPLKTAWNPFSQDVPFLTFASHPVYWHKDGGPEEKSTFDMETFAQKLQRAIEAMPSSACCIHHSPIVIQSYVGVTSLLHNKTSMGFFKVRGKFSF